MGKNIDETTFQLFRNTIKYWHKGPSPIRPLPKNRQKRIPEVRRILGRRWRFQQDNNPKHTTYVEKRMPQNIDEMKQFMAKEWNKIPDSFFESSSFKLSHKLYYVKIDVLLK
ncbi:1904_t:CDS:2 [Rhizophagus irregularis]|nr:1904_t:CDS:2 [Rhizophagus irregularis]